MRLTSLSLIILVVGFMGTVVSFVGGVNFLLLGFSFLVLFIGVVLVIIGAVVEWVESTPIFRPKKRYGIAAYTQKGEVVRSNSEQRIADYFTRNNIRYLYEQPAQSRSSGTISHPDFFLPDYGIYVEFWGLVDADDPRVQSEYQRNMKWKMAQYYRNGVKFISIYPRNLDNLDWVFRAKFKKVAGFDLPRNGSPARTTYSISR